MGLFKKAKPKDKEVGEISSSEIHVKVFKPLGGEIRVLKNEYSAREQRDEFGELVSINEGTDHKEDVDFQMDSIYNEMQVLLNLRTKNKEEKKKLLEKKIKKQERLIFFLDKVPELNAIYNYQDEWGKLRDYRVLKNYLNLDDRGSYFYVENGLRTYEFDSIDGFLIPRWHGNDTYSSYPDHTRTKKIKIQADLKFKQELAGYKLDSRLISWGFILLGIAIGLLCLVALGGYQVYMKSQDLSEPYNEASQMCLEATANLNREYSGIINDAIILKRDILEEKGENLTRTENIIRTLTPE